MNLKTILISSFFWSITLSLLGQPGERGLKKTQDTAIINGNTYAIIIGISDYKVVPDLQYAHKDAQAFENFLLSDAGGKVPRENIEAFLNENATRPNVGDAISVLARKAKSGDRIWFFFAGHGDMEDLTQIENGLLLLYNSPNGNYFGMNDDVLEILDLKRYLSPLAQRGIEMIFIVDACHSGNLKGGVEGVQQTASALASAWGKEYKILSCQPNQLSLESEEWGGGRGLFSLEFEEGIKGLADLDNNGVISMFELQNYIQSNVAKYSEGKQIPFISGDLSKPIATVNSTVLAALKKQKAESFPMLAVANTKGSEERYIDSLDDPGKKLYASFKKNLEAKQFIWPKDTNALHDYRLFAKKYFDNPLLASMRRTLAASLNERFNGIVGPLLKGETSYSSRDECYYAAAELDSCLSLLGETHYMFRNIKARKLFMEAMGSTWALNAAEYNIGYRPFVINSIKLLEESEELEPNAAYTLSALGMHYAFLYEFEKANRAFQKYIDLRPNDFSAKYTLAAIYSSLKQYDKAKSLYETLLTEHPEMMELKMQLADIYYNLGESQKAFAIINELIATDKYKGNGYFFKGIYFAKSNNLDSAILNYNLAKKNSTDLVAISNNNIGHIYFVNNKIDSARKYFKMVLDADSTEPFSNFNLGTIELQEGNTRSAMEHFIKTSEYAGTFTEGFVTNYQFYLGKTYIHVDPKLLEEFQKKTFIFNMQYLAYVSILYGYIRVPGLIEKKENIDFLFEQLYHYKQHDMFTWYHHACYKAMLHDTDGALESLEKALQMGYGNYFILTCDADIESIRNTPAFKTLLKKYFPNNK